MPQTFRGWINERWPLSIVLRWGSDEKVVGGSRLAYVFGSSLLFLFILQAVTGVWQMLYYAPTTDHAYQSVSYLRFEVPFGWLIHGLHYWGSNAFIVLLGLHTLRVFIWGAYKRPRELIWLSGVMLLLTGIALEFSGALLPWDMMGYWAAEVGSSIAGTTPLIGDFLQHCCEVAKAWDSWHFRALRIPCRDPAGGGHLVPADPPDCVPAIRQRRSVARGET